MSDQKERIVLTSPNKVKIPPRGGVLSDEQIQERIALPADNPFCLRIDPFVLGTKIEGRPSYGLSSYGYDIRLGRKFRVFSNMSGHVLDVRDFKESALTPLESECCIIPPNAYVLAETLEYFKIPEDVIAICLNKSTYCRAGIGLNMSPLEAGWKGVLTLEIANHTPLPNRIWAGDGIGQILFLEGSRPCKTPYNKKGHPQYQNQKGLTLPKV